jgi:hypothetical protein
MYLEMYIDCLIAFLEKHMQKGRGDMSVFEK